MNCVKLRKPQEHKPHLLFSRSIIITAVNTSDAGEECLDEFVCFFFFVCFSAVSIQLVCASAPSSAPEYVSDYRCNTGVREQSRDLASCIYVPVWAGLSCCDVTGAQPIRRGQTSLAAVTNINLYMFFFLCVCGNNEMIHSNINGKFKRER